MATVIIDKRGRSDNENKHSEDLKNIEYLYSVLPEKLLRELEALEERTGGRVSVSGAEEIRLRRGRRASVTVADKNISLATILSGEEIDATVTRICDGSLYAHSETIKNGYLTVSKGIRVGICGRAVCEGDSVIGVYDISSLNFRMPKNIFRVGEEIAELLLREGQGILIYSPPGVGKTTLLRNVARELSSERIGMRVALIDTRQELTYSLDGGDGLVDVLSGYPRALGIEIAVRSMNPQVIICDEIGESREAMAIASSQNSGVPFVASAHGCCVEGILCRKGIRILHDAGVFGYYVGISRKDGKEGYEYNITNREAVDDWLQNSGGGDLRHMRRSGIIRA